MTSEERIIALEKEIAELKRQLNPGLELTCSASLVEKFKSHLSKSMQKAELEILFRLGICNINDQLRLGLMNVQDTPRTEAAEKR